MSKAALTPREIVSELDRYIVGQQKAKMSVAIALRNRWRRQQLSPQLKEEVLPKNILMIGPTGVGKTEIARRLSKLANAPFTKVEATKFTEVGYVGRDVEQIIRDLVDVAILKAKEQSRIEVKVKAEMAAENRILDILVGENATTETRKKFREKLRNGELKATEVEIEVDDTASSHMPTIDVPGMPGAQMGMLNLGDLFGKAFGGKTKKLKLKVNDALKALVTEESDKLLDQESLISAALKDVEENGIVFIDEIDKICARSERQEGSVSREGVQRDLLPLLEGTTVSTKYGPVNTDHILFISSGAFHVAKPSDLLPELQGRLPIRVELHSLGKDDFVRILKEPEVSLIKQYIALLKTEEVTLIFEEEGLDEIASLAAHINENIENIGARRLHTVLEKLLEDISFSASDRGGEIVNINREYVQKTVGELAQKTDLSKFIL